MKNKIILITLIFSGFALASCKSGKEKLSEKITTGEQILFNDSTKMLNADVAASVLKSYREYAEKYETDTQAANYLFKAGDLANGMRQYKEAIEILGQFRKKYPRHQKAAVSLFLCAFIYDNNLRDVEKAKMLYSEFLREFPNHQLAASAQASLNQLNMGLTDEELIRMFEAKQDSLEKNN